MAVETDRLNFVWLEITGRCQLRCQHCYADSGPEGDHGTMTADDWRCVIDQAAELGGQDVQMIGGEPTLHPDLAELVRHALSRGLGVEIYSNLARPLPQELWSLLQTRGVRLATSYYSTDARTHDVVTAATGSHRRTRANIIEALHRSIPIRVGIVDVERDQEVERARAELTALGVREINIDRVRQVGRGARGSATTVEELCGHCADDRLAVLPNGDVAPCPLARWLIVGNVHADDLESVNGQARTTRQMLLREFARRGRRQVAGSPPDAKCPPDDADPCGGPLCSPHITCGPDKDDKVHQ